MNTNYEKTVGNNIRKIREDSKITQDMLATKLQLMGCDITRSAVAKIKVGQRHIYPDEIKLQQTMLSFFLWMTSPLSCVRQNQL